MASTGAIILGVLFLIGGFFFFSSINAAEAEAASSNPLGYFAAGYTPAGQRAYEAYDTYRMIGLGAMGLGGLLIVVGAAIGGGKEKVVIQQSTPISNTQTEKIIGKYCADCGTKTTPNSKFCSSCGKETGGS